MAKYKFDDIAVNSTKKKVPSEDEYKTYIGLEHLDTKSIFVNRWGSNVPIIGQKLIMKKGDVLLGKRNAYLRRAAIAPHDGVFSAHGMVLRPKENVVDKDFFPLFIASDYFFDAAIRISVGSLSPTINWKDLKDLEFELPTLEEQRKIARALWSIIKTIESYKNSYQACDDLIKGKLAELEKDPSTKKNTLDAIADNWFKGQQFKKEEMCDDGEYPCIHYGELFLKYGPFIKETFSKTNSKPTRFSKYGDIVFPASDVTPNGLSRCSAILDDGIIYGGDIIVMRHTNSINPVYLSYAINYQKEQLLNRVTGSVIKHLSATSLKSVSIFVPKKTLQNEFEAFAMKVEETKQSLNKGVIHLEKLYAKLANKYLKED